MKTASAKKRGGDHLEKGTLMFGAGLWVSNMLRTKEFRLATAGKNTCLPVMDPKSGSVACAAA